MVNAIKVPMSVKTFSQTTLMSGIKSDAYIDGSNAEYLITTPMLFEQQKNIVFKNCNFIVPSDADFDHRLAFGFIDSQGIVFENCTLNFEDFDPRVNNYNDQQYVEKAKYINNIFIGFFNCRNVTVTKNTFSGPAKTHIRFIRGSNFECTHNTFSGKNSLHGVEISCGNTGDPDEHTVSPKLWEDSSIWPNAMSGFGPIFADLSFRGKGTDTHRVDFEKYSGKPGTFWKTYFGKSLKESTIEMTNRWFPEIVEESDTHFVVKSESNFPDGQKFSMFFHDMRREVTGINISNNFFSDYLICGATMYYVAGFRYENNTCRDMRNDYYMGAEFCRKGVIRFNICISSKIIKDNENVGCRIGLLARTSDIWIEGNMSPIEINPKNCPVFNISTDQKLGFWHGNSPWEKPNTIIYRNAV